jgi:hypothetical protein
MQEATDHKREMYEKACILVNLIEADADDDVIGMTVKLLAIDYLQFCQQVGLNPVNPMSQEKKDLQ